MREFSDYLNAIDEPEEVPDEIIDRIGPIVFGPNSQCTMLVAEDDDQVMGFLTYFWGLSMEGVGLAVFVGDLFVSAPYRRKGVGRTLMERTRVIAAESGALQLNWTVWRKNRAAQTFYASFGGRQYEEEVLMTLSIGEPMQSHD